VSRLPVRWTLALAFAATAALVLCALGAFLYVRVSGELTEGLDRGLRARSDELTAVFARSTADLARPTRSALEADERVAQLVLAADGRVVATSGPRRVLLTPGQLERARHRAQTVDRRGDALLDEGSRLRAGPISASGTRYVLVVGASLDDRDEALSALLLAEVVGLLLALALISAGGYVVSGLVLRPERAALARERRFLADASHELRTPLTILRSEVDVALLEEPTVERLQAALRSTAVEAQRLTQLTEDLLALARAQDGQLPIRIEPVDARALLDGIASRRWPRAVRVVDPGDLVLHADPVRLGQALTNLVDNAMRHGGGAVELAARSDDGTDLLSVRDHGAGLPPGFAERAFERFSRADAGRTAGGTGLGLAIVRAVVEAHGGTIRLDAAQPGTVATIRLPHRSLMPPAPPSSP